jgi:hypothetical protein
MGFGHRVYKNYDPRAKIIRRMAHQVFEVTGKNPLIDIALELERIALQDEYFVSRKLYPNVDFYSGIIYEAMNLPVAMFPVLFAIARTRDGWRSGPSSSPTRSRRSRARSSSTSATTSARTSARSAPRRRRARDGGLRAALEASGDEAARCRSRSRAVVRERASIRGRREARHRDPALDGRRAWAFLEALSAASISARPPSRTGSGRRFSTRGSCSDRG